jgi:hypothetical protein
MTLTLLDDGDLSLAGAVYRYRDDKPSKHRSRLRLARYPAKNSGSSKTFSVMGIFPEHAEWLRKLPVLALPAGH